MNAQFTPSRGIVYWLISRTTAVLLVSVALCIPAAAVWVGWNVATGQDWQRLPAAFVLLDSQAAEAAQGQAESHDPALGDVGPADNAQPGPVVALGYQSQAEAGASCETGPEVGANYRGVWSVEPIYRQRQIVGYSCNLTVQ